MVFAKALCVVLLLCSASLSESRNLKNDSNSEKRANKLNPLPKTPYQIADEIERMARKTVYVGGSQQLGYVYLHPPSSNDVTFVHGSVMQILGKLYLDDKVHIWPNDGKTTNFRFAKPDYSQDDKTNKGHSEYQLLTDNRLTKMVTDFRASYGCPQYVILYSSNLPCVSPQNPINVGPRCAEMVVNAREELRAICAQALFYLYTTHEVPSSVNDLQLHPDFQASIRKKINFFKNKDIIWINRENQNGFRQ